MGKAAEDSEARIVRRVLQGNPEEYREIVQRFQQPVFRLSFNLTGDRQEAEDITQDVFLAAFHGLASFDANKAALKTWLLTIARNRCINFLKRRRLPVAGPDSERDQADANQNAAERHEFWEHFDRALSELPVEQRAVFVLAEIEQLGYAEIAEIENTSLGTVKSRLHRAKGRLRAILTPSLREA